MSVKIQHEASLHARLASLAEDALFDAGDEAVLVIPGMRAMARDARAIVEVAVRSARSASLALPVEPRRSGRRPVRRTVPPRAIMRQLLVASPRARDIVGKSGVDAMTDTEVAAALERLVALGIVPGQEE